jgi:hypothetical protein
MLFHFYALLIVNATVTLVIVVAESTLNLKVSPALIEVVQPDSVVS